MKFIIILATGVNILFYIHLVNRYNDLYIKYSQCMEVAELYHNWNNQLKK